MEGLDLTLEMEIGLTGSWGVEAMVGVRLKRNGDRIKKRDVGFS